VFVCDTGIDLPCCDMVFMSSSESKTDNEQRAARAMRLYPGKKTATIAIWSPPENMTDLCSLAYAAAEVKVNYTCIEGTDMATERRVAAAAKAEAIVRHESDINVREYKYQQWIDHCKEHLATGQKIERGTVHKEWQIGLWVNRQQRVARKGRLYASHMQMCQDAGIQIDKVQMTEMQEKFDFFKYCVDNKISMIRSKKAVTIVYNGHEINPGSQLSRLRTGWTKWNLSGRRGLKALAFTNPLIYGQKASLAGRLHMQTV
jgi:hypothetical protein